MVDSDVRYHQPFAVVDRRIHARRFFSFDRQHDFLVGLWVSGRRQGWPYPLYDFVRGFGNASKCDRTNSHVHPRWGEWSARRVRRDLCVDGDCRDLGARKRNGMFLLGRADFLGHFRSPDFYPWFGVHRVADGHAVFQ